MAVVMTKREKKKLLKYLNLWSDSLFERGRENYRFKEFECNPAFVGAMALQQNKETWEKTRDQINLENDAVIQALASLEGQE